MDLWSAPETVSIQVGIYESKLDHCEAAAIRLVLPQPDTFLWIDETAGGSFATWLGEANTVTLGVVVGKHKSRMDRLEFLDG